jgi:hypothetical protein
MQHNVNWSQDESEYERRYGKSERHRFNGKNGPSIPCKYPERGPMLYEVLEYYGDMTRVMNEQHGQQRSLVTDPQDEFIFPRETRGCAQQYAPPVMYFYVVPV